MILTDNLIAIGMSGYVLREGVQINWKKLLDAFNQLTEGENCIGVPMVHISTKKNTPLEANVLGSSQLTNSTRIVARVEEDPEDSDKKGLYVVKSNVGPQRSGQLPIGFRIKTLGENLPYAGVQYHPEVEHSEYGSELFQNFLNKAIEWNE